MIDAIIAAGQEVAACRARVAGDLGEGKAFWCGHRHHRPVGHDKQGPDALMPRTTWRKPQTNGQEVAMIWSRMDIPVIAAIHAGVFWCGHPTALCADIRRYADAKLVVAGNEMGHQSRYDGLCCPLVRDGCVLRRLTHTADPIGAEQSGWGITEDSVIRWRPRPSWRDDTMRAGKSPAAIRAAKKLIAMAETDDAGMRCYWQNRAQQS
jgi:enoyl-CoA hydratase/carnithine racemase